jgi:hypothetical protein
MKYTSVNQPQYADERNRTINCWVKFEDHPNPLPFTASPEDKEVHAKQILSELKSGKYGAIAPFVGEYGNP